MTKLPEIVDLFEQEAARRVAEAHQQLVAVAIAPNRTGLLTELDCTRMEASRSRYLREHRRHNIWFKRRCEAGGINFAPLQSGL